jgi:enediyne biosynthesis protein E4
MRSRTPFPRSQLGAILIASLCALPGCGNDGGTAAPPAVASPISASTKPAPKEKTVPSPFRFEERAAASGIDFVHVSGMTADRHFPTANGSGVAILDYDNDGRMDLYFATNNLLPLETRPKASNKLYRNLGSGKFQDVTESAKVGFRGFCHGVIAADLDNDGDTDMLLCNYGSNVLYLNNGDGTFRDVSKEAGVSLPNWSTGGAVLDYDNDGNLDIYVANYGSWDIATDGLVKCPSGGKIRQYCSPATIKTVEHILYRNEGVKDGIPRFRNATKDAKINRPDGHGHGFGVVAADLNGDGKIDLFVANDQDPSFVFYNKGDGKFEDATEWSGAAYDSNGHKQAGMGLDAEDANGDGQPELIRANFRNEAVSYYQNEGNGLFQEQSAFVGLAAAAMPWIKWGCALADFDNDGWPDVFVTNGHVDDNFYLLGDKTQPYEEPPLLFVNQGGKSFASCAPGSGPYFETDHVGRGAAFGDLDDDGRMDIVVSHRDAPPAVLFNRSPGGNHWVRLVLKGKKTNRDAVGAKVKVIANGRTIYRQRKGGGSMESTNDPRLLIGVGDATKIDKIIVHWPSGAPDSVLENVQVDQSITIEESVPEKQP